MVFFEKTFVDTGFSLNFEIKSFRYGIHPTNTPQILES